MTAIFSKSVSLTIGPDSGGSSASGRLFGIGLSSPIVVLAFLLVVLLLLRLPTTLTPREFNLDESQLISQGMKFLVDPLPWKAVDGGSDGPLNSYLISIFLRMGFKPGYVLAHALADLLICLQVFVAYLTLRRLSSNQAATLGGGLLVFLYGTYTHAHYLHYDTELLPTLFLTLGFYLYVVWLDETVEPGRGVRLVLLFLAGLALGTAPWSKLQAVPITGALGLLGPGGDLPGSMFPLSTGRGG